MSSFNLQPPVDSVHGRSCICHVCRPSGSDVRHYSAGQVSTVAHFTPYRGRLLAHRSVV